MVEPTATSVAPTEAIARFNAAEARIYRSASDLERASLTIVGRSTPGEVPYYEDQTDRLLALVDGVVKQQRRKAEDP